MTGPKVTRLPASEPSLHNPAISILQSIFGAPTAPRATGYGGIAQTLLGQSGPLTQPGGTIENALNQRFGFGAPTSALQSQVQDTFLNFLRQPGAEGRTADMTNYLQSAGQDILGTLTPLFQRNLADAIGLSREQGARFSSAQDVNARDITTRATQDFTAQAAQILQNARAQALNEVQAAGQFAGQTGAQSLQAQQQQIAILGELLKALFGTGLSPGSTVGPSPLSQALGGIGSLAGGAAALGFSPFAPKK